MPCVPKDAIVRIVPYDPDDDALIACALAARASLIVSGDRHVVRLGEYEGIRIALAAEAVTLVEGSR